MGWIGLPWSFRVYMHLAGDKHELGSGGSHVTIEKCVGHSQTLKKTQGTRAHVHGSVVHTTAIDKIEPLQAS